MAYGLTLHFYTGVSGENIIETQCNDPDDSRIAIEVNPSYNTAIAEVHMTKSNITDHAGHNDAAHAYDSPIAMEGNPSYVAVAEVHNMPAADIYSCNDTAHDSHITMESNPSYMPMAFAEVHMYNRRDSDVDAGNVCFQANPSYIALPMTLSQAQDSVLCTSQPVSRFQSAAACNLDQYREDQCSAAV